MADVRYEAGVRQTQAFIDVNPVEVVVTRKAKVPTPAGGFKDGPPAPLPPQTMRLCAEQRMKSDQVMATSDGALDNPPWMLVALPGADIRKGDDVAVPGQGNFEVDFVSVKPAWRVNAAVTQRA